MSFGLYCSPKFYACNDEAPEGSKLISFQYKNYYYLPMIGIVDKKPSNPNIKFEKDDTIGFYYKVDEHHYKNISDKCDNGTYSNATKWGTGQELQYNDELKIYYVEVMYVV